MDVRINLEGCEIRKGCKNISGQTGWRRAFTLIEMLVVISIISVLMGILVPALNVAKRQVRAIMGMHNQKELANGLNLFSMDNRDLYPDSVATVGTNDWWNWSHPTKMTGDEARSPQTHRSMSAYLASYIPNAKIMSCPSAPKQQQYLQAAWDAGDEWDCPDTIEPADPFGGTYCFYWNYTGYLTETTRFRGPTGPAGGSRRSKLLVSDYFGYNNWRSPDAFSSCEKLGGSKVVSETYVLSSYWAKTADDPDEDKPKVTLRAAFTDGHVESYSSSDVVPMQVSMASDGGPPPYQDGPGIVYVPRAAVE